MLELPKSPSGSLCPYYYLGGELHPLKYGDYGRDHEGLLAVMLAEQDFILASPGTHNRRVWVDLYQTVLDDVTVAMLVEHLQAIRPKVLKLCMVGCSLWERCRLRAVILGRRSTTASTTGGQTSGSSRRAIGTSTSGTC